MPLNTKASFLLQLLFQVPEGGSLYYAYANLLASHYDFFQ